MPNIITPRVDKGMCRFANFTEFKRYILDEKFVFTKWKLKQLVKPLTEAVIAQFDKFVMTSSTGEKSEPKPIVPPYIQNVKDYNNELHNLRENKNRND